MEEAKWYVIHTYSGYEDLVKANIEQMIENNHLQDEIFDIRYSSQIWYLITNTRGVTGFVGPQGKALPLSDEEVKRLRLETVVTDFKLNVGDFARIISGPFEGQVGTIKTIDQSKQKVSVAVSMFGRETTIDMDFVQVEAV